MFVRRFTLLPTKEPLSFSILSTVSLWETHSKWRFRRLIAKLTARAELREPAEISRRAVITNRGKPPVGAV